MRVTQKDLELLVKRINEETNNPTTTHTKTEDGHFKANIGNYHLDYAYGGVKLVQTMTEGGGIRTVSCGGYETKKNLYHQLIVFLAGVESNKEK